MTGESTAVTSSKRKIAQERRRLNRSVERAMPTLRAMDIAKANQIKHAHRHHKGTIQSSA